MQLKTSLNDPRINERPVGQTIREINIYTARQTISNKVSQPVNELHEWICQLVKKSIK